jgi:hypothetical protein
MKHNADPLRSAAERGTQSTLLSISVNLGLGLGQMLRWFVRKFFRTDCGPPGFDHGCAQRLGSLLWPGNRDQTARRKPSLWAWEGGTDCRSRGESRFNGGCTRRHLSRDCCSGALDLWENPSEVSRSRMTLGTTEVMPSRLHLLLLVFPSRYWEGRGGKRPMAGQPSVRRW